MPPRTFLVNGNNSQKFRLNGIKPSLRLPRKQQLCQAFRDHVVYQPNQLPSRVDLRPYMTPVEDQSQIGSCSANCLAGAYEYLTKRATGRDIDVSRLFIYYNGRVKNDKSQNVTDSGCSMTSAIEALEEYGTCLESIWPYNISQVNTRPNNQAYQEAQNHKITEALQVDINLNEMKSCLAQGFPFAFGIKLYSSFDEAAKTGIVPMPSAEDVGRQSHGSHALLAVGYSDQSRAFIVRNSWGESWGERGYCHMPYDYIANSQYTFDVWTVRKLATDNFGRDHWVSNDWNHSSAVQAHHHNHRRQAIIQSFEESDGDNDNGSFNQQTNDDDPWGQFQVYQNCHHSRHHHKHHSHRPPGDFSGGNNPPTPFYNQNQGANNFPGFRSGSPNFFPFYNRSPGPFNNPFVNLAPSPFINPFFDEGPPPFNNPFINGGLPPQRPIFGLNYQYADPRDRFFNPFY